MTTSDPSSRRAYEDRAANSRSDAGEAETEPAAQRDAA
jgi:hypothetical protein